jgi:hypothetical protein
MSNTTLIGSQAQDLVQTQLSRQQQPRNNQNQGLWQQQLEQASLWQTNQAITTFKSAYALPAASSQQETVVGASQGQSALYDTDSLGLAKPEAEATVQGAATSRTTLAVQHSVEHRGQAIIYSEGHVQASSAAQLATDKAEAVLSSQQARTAFTQAVHWQKQHVFLSDIEGVKQLWIRDSAVTKGMSARLAANLLGSMAQLGVELNSVVVNGQQVFVKNHGIKE